MLTKHPDQYGDEELESWVRHLVDYQVSEGPRLDYKEAIPLDSKGNRLEAAKDISSFANEIGGTIIYGIPEDKQSDEVAVPRKPYGIKPIADLESRLENIYVDSIAPRLPEWRIRKVKLTEYPGKVVYVTWTPESWIGVHMVEAYGDQRYYRRGLLRAVPMEEHEVRARYERTRGLQSAAEDFLNSPQLNYIRAVFPKCDFISHYVVCPVMLIAERVDFANQGMREWLNANRYPFEWLPFANGVRNGFPKHILEPCGYSEIFRNGAISHCVETMERDAVFAYLAELEQIEEFLRFACRFYEQIQYFGPLRFRVIIENRTITALMLPRRRIVTEYPVLIAPDRKLSIDVTQPSSRLFENHKLVLKEIADQMFRAFGLWEADCFDEQLNLKRS